MAGTYMGCPTDRGRLVIGNQYPKEGYAVIRCGGTEIQVGYTLLHHVLLEMDSKSPVFKQLVDLQKALWSITAEAAEGHTGDS